MSELFLQTLKELSDICNSLVDVWQGEEDTEIKNYPEYLPSFDEFAEDIRKMYKDNLTTRNN